MKKIPSFEQIGSTKTRRDFFFSLIVVVLSFIYLFLRPRMTTTAHLFLESASGDGFCSVASGGLFESETRWASPAHLSWCYLWNGWAEIQLTKHYSLRVYICILYCPFFGFQPIHPRWRIIALHPFFLPLPLFKDLSEWVIVTAGSRIDGLSQACLFAVDCTVQTLVTVCRFSRSLWLQGSEMSVVLWHLQMGLFGSCHVLRLPNWLSCSM